MLGSVFYHNLIRKYVITYGNLFNDIIIRRFDKDNNVIQNIPVPIQYGPKQKYIYAMQKPLDERQVSVTLPRISFNITGINYDSERQINKINRRRNCNENENGSINSSFVEVPYKMDFELSIYVKNYDDGAQIVEQIMPYFTPSYTNQVKLIPELGEDGYYDIKFELTSGPNIEDNYEGSSEETRFIIFTFNFTADIFFFGPVEQKGVIKRVQTDFVIVNGNEEITNNDYEENGRNVRINTTPGLTEDGEPTSNPALTIPYMEIEETDPYGFIKEKDFFVDGKRFNPVTGRDE